MNLWKTETNISLLISNYFTSYSDTLFLRPSVRARLHTGVPVGRVSHQEAPPFHSTHLEQHRLHLHRLHDGDARPVPVGALHLQLAHGWSLLRVVLRDGLFGYHAQLPQAAEPPRFRHPQVAGVCARLLRRAGSAGVLHKRVISVSLCEVTERECPGECKYKNLQARYSMIRSMHENEVMPLH